MVPTLDRGSLRIASLFSVSGVENQMIFKRYVIGESFPSKVCAIYASRKDAEEATHKLITEGNFSSDQIKIANPGDVAIDRKIEPERRGIALTLLKSHLILGGLFLILGVVIATFLSFYGVPATRASPMMTYIAVILISLFIGLILAGLISLRPDHDILIYKAEKAAETDKWTVIVHCKNRREINRAKTCVEASAATL